MFEPFDYLGSYADGYCEDLAPSALPHFYHAAGSVSFRRLPAYPRYQLRFDQATQFSAGREAFAFEPYAQELLIELEWPRMAKADKENLEVFFRDVANGTANVFTYSNNNVIGPALPVRFAEASLPQMPEVAYQQYQVSLTLRVACNFPQMAAPGGVPNAALSGHRFVIGSLTVPLPPPIRGGSGSGLAKLQPAGRDSAGDLVIYDRGRITQLSHRVVIRHGYDEFCRLQAFFFSFAHGARNTFTWVDESETSRTVRLSGNSITVQQLGPDRYETELGLSEEQAA